MRGLLVSELYAFILLLSTGWRQLELPAGADYPGLISMDEELAWHLDLLFLMAVLVDPALIWFSSEENVRIRLAAET